MRAFVGTVEVDETVDEATRVCAALDTTTSVRLAQYLCSNRETVAIPGGLLGQPDGPAGHTTSKAPDLILLYNPLLTEL